MDDKENTDAMDRTLWNLYLHVGHVMMRAREMELGKSAITSRQANLLQIIRKRDGAATPTEIARTNCREPASISGMLGRLERQGYIKRIPSAEKGNQVNVSITAKGELALDAVSARKSIYRIMSCLDAEEKENLNRLLGKLRESVAQEIADNYRDNYFGAVAATSPE
jgi:DNA-binding MarR family transcriptional regulator